VHASLTSIEGVKSINGSFTIKSSLLEGISRVELEKG
jgi:hypothetical protein